MGSDAVRLSEARVVGRSRELRRRWAGRTVVPSILVGAVLVAVGMAKDLHWVGLGGLSLLMGLSAAVWWTVARAGAAPAKSCAVLFSKDAISFEGEERVNTIRRDEVEGAWAKDGTVTLRLHTGRDVEISLSDHTVAEKALAASRLSPYELSMRIPVASELPLGPFSKALMTFVVFTCATGFSAIVGWTLQPADLEGEGTVIGGTGVVVMFVPVIAIVLTKWLKAVRRRHVTVGTDSVVIEGPSAATSVPLGQIDGVSEDDEGVKLALSDGKEIVLPAVPGGEGLLPRIEHALRCRGRARGENHDLELLARGDLSGEQWKQKLRDLPLDRGEQYRERFVGREALAVVIDDAEAPPEQRVAAAVVLSGDASERTRIHAAAASCADDDMRAALEAAAQGEIEEEALARAEKRLVKS